MKSLKKISFLLLKMLLITSSFSAMANTAEQNLGQHPLFTGSMSAEDAEPRLFQFIHELNKKKKHRKSRYWIYNEFIEDIGTLRIKNYLEAVNPSCHGVSHALGKVIAEKEPDLNKGMQLCNDTCTYGCIHGVFKRYFNKLGTEYHQAHQHTSSKMSMKKVKHSGLSPEVLAKFSKDVNAACANPVSVVEDFFRGNCAHGVGHAMGMLAVDSQQATEYCKVFNHKMMQFYCETGVFMELARHIRKEIFLVGATRNERLVSGIEYCSKVSKMSSSCLRFITWRNKNLPQVQTFARMCDKEVGAARRGCFNTLGYSTRSFLASNPTKVNQVCEMGKFIDKKACVSGFSYMKKGHRHRDNIRKACMNLKNNKLKSICLTQSKRYYYKIDNQIFKSIL